jgi:uncharacterized protein YjbI with pentapeptide repeats
MSWRSLDFDFTGAMFDGGDFSHAVFCGRQVDFRLAVFSGGHVGFGGAKFSGGRVGFSGAQFSGSEVDFVDARDWSVPPEFPWTGTPPAGVKLP